MLTSARWVIGACLIGTLTASSAAQDEQSASQPAAPQPLTRALVFGDDAPDFSGEYVRGIRWSADGSAYYVRDDGWQRVDPLSGEQQPAYDATALRDQIGDDLGLSSAAQRRIARRVGMEMLFEDTVLIQEQGQLYIYNRSDNRFRRLAGEDRAREVVTLGPDGRYVYCIRDNDLYAISVDSGSRKRLTRGGKEHLLNGKLDWVYQEEIYGRGRWRGYWPREDERYVAYLQLDESQVPVYSIVRSVEARPRIEKTHYPKAGDPNPTVRMGITSTMWGITTWVDLSRYRGLDFLITEVSWAPDGKLLFSVQDREQRWLDLNEADPGTGRSRVLLHEMSPAWIESVPHPHWLDDGTFLWLSERDGYKHLYHYARDGKLLQRLTSGAWEARNLLGVDPQGKWAYFMGTRDTELESHAYRVALNSADETAEIQRLTEPGFHHRCTFDPTFSMFVDTYSNVTTPHKVALRAVEGGLVRMLSENEVADLDNYVWSRPELVHFNARDGFRLHGKLTRPPDYQAGRRYPIWCKVYGGPGSQTVYNRWGGSGQLRDQVLAGMGYVVFNVDPRSGGGHGACATWQSYQRLGQVELRDIEDGIQWLIEEGVADSTRIGLTGHSYGGYMTAYALTHSEMFTLGIAGAPVTDWRNYDTIYTERYMRIPDNNPDGYRDSSAVVGAENLHGQLLIVHGTLDDNVHFQNAVQLIEALQKHKKQFDVMIYPRDRHGIWNGQEHYRDLTYDYIREHL